MPKRKHNVLTKIVSLLLILVMPDAQAQSLVMPGIPKGTLDLSKFKGISDPIWDHLATKLYEDEGISPVPEEEKEELSRYFFADYLGYLNAIGLELASSENSLIARTEIRKQGECSDETIQAFNELLTNSVQSDLYTFTDVYCNNACRQKAEMDFGLIANFAQPDDRPQTCTDRAREMYDTYHCNMTGDTAPDFTDSDLRGEPLLIQGPGTRASIDQGGSPDGKLLPKISTSGTTARIDPTLSEGGSTGSIPRFRPLPKLSSISRIEADRGFKNVLSKQKQVCTKKRSDLLRQTFASPGSTFSSSASTPIVRNPNDPRWTTTEKPLPGSEKLENSKPKNPACKSSGPEMFDHFASLRRAYQRIADSQISNSLGHWPIWDENGSINKDMRIAIRRISDSFFNSLLSDIEVQNRRICGAGRASLTSMEASTITIIPGQTHKVIIRGEDTGTIVMPGEDDDAEEETEPVTVATYFNANQSLVDALINGFTGGSAQTGAGTHTEVRAGEIAAGVQGGVIDPADIPSEATKGPQGKNAEEIEKLTRQYLAQGDYQGLKVFAAELLGGVLSGGLITGTAAGVRAVGSKLVMTASSGRISAVLTATRTAIMRPMLVGGETGALDFGSIAFRKYFESARRLGIPPSDLNRVVNQTHHVFGSTGRNSLSRHNLDRVLRSFDNDAVAAFKSIENKLQYLADDGLLSDGVFRDVVISVNGYPITTRGRVIGGFVNLSTAFIPK